MYNLRLAEYDSADAEKAMDVKRRHAVYCDYRGRSIAQLQLLD